MATASNATILVVCRFLLACPFMVNAVLTLLLLSKKDTATLAVDQVRLLTQPLGEWAEDVPEDKLAIFLAIMQGMGGFLMVFNHHFGGLLLVLYLLPVTALRYQFWYEDPSNYNQLLEVLGSFLKNLAIVGGIIAFMSTTDHVPLKVKRKRD